MNTMHVTPRELTAGERKQMPGCADRTHVRCIDPADGTELPAEGRKVPRSAYWMKRLRQGDVKQKAIKSTGKRQTAGRTTKKPQSED